MLVEAHRRLASFFKKGVDFLRLAHTRCARQISTACHRDHNQQEGRHNGGCGGECAVALPEAQIRDGEADAAEDERVPQPPEQPRAEARGPPALSPGTTLGLLESTSLAERGFGVRRSVRLDKYPAQYAPPRGTVRPQTCEPLGGRDGLVIAALLLQNA